MSGPRPGPLSGRPAEFALHWRLENWAEVAGTLHPHPPTHTQTPTVLQGGTRAERALTGTVGHSLDVCFDTLITLGAGFSCENRVRIPL